MKIAQQGGYDAIIVTHAQPVIPAPGETAQVCAVSRSAGLATFDGQAEAAQQVPRAHVVDVTSLYCTATVCPPVIGHVLVYKDRTHITATFADTLAPYIEREVVAALAG